MERLTINKGKRSINRMAALLCAACFALGAAGFISCSDMIETESSRQNIEPEILSKTDSLFYGYGILQAMQQLADQYVMQGEMRGDLVKTTVYTDNHLRQLADFSATTANRYDSAYVYYRVINNCNYYIAHRNKELYTGSTNVVQNEYAAVMAIRAWAYLQLGRNYERVPFFTVPLTKISQIDDNYFPELDLNGIVSMLAPELEKYSGLSVPNYGITGSGTEIGSPNWETTAKRFLPRLCFIPVDVVLGDMYLETGNYDQAAQHFVTYLTKVASTVNSPFLAPMQAKDNGFDGRGMNADTSLPDRGLISDNGPSALQWSRIFERNATDDIISYIPMAVNRQNGTVTNVPLIFGFNYYATNEERSDNGESQPYVDEVQLLPSDALCLLSDSTEYYYYFDNKSADLYDSIQLAKAGDMRLRSILHRSRNTEPVKEWIDKYKYANVILYRTSTVLLHLAEAFNRLGMPDAAFAILKDGICPNLIEARPDGGYYCTYISDDTRQNLQLTYPLLSQENSYLFPNSSAYGIHCHGAGKAASDFPGTNRTGGNTYHSGKGASPYQLDRMVGMKMQELAADFGIAIGATKRDTINAVEDLLCDEYALELAFEGNRFYDLCRLARHKNEAALYGADFGSKWLARKLDFKKPTKALTDPKNWYLPFK